MFTSRRIISFSCRFYGEQNVVKAKHIKYSKQDRTLTVEFDNGHQYTYLAEYLRVFSPAAGVHTIKEHNIPNAPRQLVANRKNVEIIGIDHVGSYGITIHFDDLHSEGIYSWSLLYSLGQYKLRNMRAYIKLLKFFGKTRNRRQNK